MLQGMTCASPPAFRMPSAAASQASALRLEITTFAPSFARSSAEERPMPRLEPVMTATLPVRSNGVDGTDASFLRSPDEAKRNPGPAPAAFPDYPPLHSGYGLNTNNGVMDSGFARRRAPRNDGTLHQPAALADAAEVVVGVAKGVFDHRQALEVVADLRLHGHADAAM